MNHLSMDQLLALRDGDRSEPGMAEAGQHFATCALCQNELDRLHQRTARLRALPTLAPVSNEFPAVRARITVERRHRHWRSAAGIVIGMAATLVMAVIGRDLVHPTRLDAEQQLRSEISRSQQLEQQLEAWNPDERVLDGRTTMVVIQLEDRIADLDAQLAAPMKLQRKAQIEHQLKLWKQRVGLMNVLVDVHLTKASNVGL